MIKFWFKNRMRIINYKKYRAYLNFYVVNIFYLIRGTPKKQLYFIEIHIIINTSLEKLHNHKTDK